jgi:hypothetical protein
VCLRSWPRSTLSLSHPTPYTQLAWMTLDVASNCKWLIEVSWTALQLCAGSNLRLPLLLAYAATACAARAAALHSASTCADRLAACCLCSLLQPFSASSPALTALLQLCTASARPDLRWLTCCFLLVQPAAAVFRVFTCADRLAASWLCSNWVESRRRSGSLFSSARAMSPAFPSPKNVSLAFLPSLSRFSLSLSLSLSLSSLSFFLFLSLFLSLSLLSLFSLSLYSRFSSCLSLYFFSTASTTLSRCSSMLLCLSPTHPLTHSVLCFCLLAVSLSVDAGGQNFDLPLAKTTLKSIQTRL